jgi:putative serine/threonine protein kinase
MEVYAKGKRGVIYKDGGLCIKEKNPRSAVDTLANEAQYLQLLNKKGIGPRFIKYEDGKLFRQFVEGIRISEFFEQEYDKENILSVITQILEQCREMDLMGIDKKELTNPYKDILITTDNKAVMIDFERCKESKKPQNLTQFLQYIIKNKPTLEPKGIMINKDELIRLGREYKENPDEESFDKIIKFISEKESE